MLQELKTKALNAMNEAIKCTEQSDIQEITRILNCEYHMAKYFTYLELIDEISFNEMVAIKQRKNADETRCLKFIDTLYHNYRRTA